MKISLKAQLLCLMKVNLIRAGYEIIRTLEKLSTFSIVTASRGKVLQQSAKPLGLVLKSMLNNNPELTSSKAVSNVSMNFEEFTLS